MPAPSLKQAHPDQAVVLTKATLRAADFLGLNNGDLSAVLGVSESSVTRLRKGGRTIEPSSKEGDLALTLIRVFRSLDPLVGGDASKCRRWMNSDNKALAGQKPKKLIATVTGLVQTLSYLDGMRAAT